MKTERNGGVVDCREDDVVDEAAERGKLSDWIMEHCRELDAN
jgi:hypothetical protein